MDDSGTLVLTMMIIVLLIFGFFWVDYQLGHEETHEGTIILKGYDDGFFVVVLCSDGEKQLDVTYAEYKTVEEKQQVTLAIRKGGITNRDCKKEMTWKH